MSKPVSATFTYTRDEYILAMRRHYEAQLRMRRDVIGSSLVITWGAYLVFTSDAVWTGSLLIGVGVVLMSMVGYAVLLLPRMIYNLQPKLKDQYSLKFSNEGIAFKTNHIDSMLQWSMYQSWRSDRDFYFMYHGKRDLSVIPRRALPDDDDERLRVFLTENIGPPRA